ncbi:MAG: hypothetical protein ACLUIP_11310, partial [Anaerobutyricum hallii]
YYLIGKRECHGTHGLPCTLYECVVELFQVATRASSFEFEEVGNIDSIFSSKRSVRSRVGVGRCRKDCYLTSEQAEIYSSQPQKFPTSSCYLAQILLE